MKTLTSCPECKGKQKLELKEGEVFREWCKRCHGEGLIWEIDISSASATVATGFYDQGFKAGRKAGLEEAAKLIEDRCGGQDGTAILAQLIRNLGDKGEV